MFAILVWGNMEGHGRGEHLHPVMVGRISHPVRAFLHSIVLKGADAQLALCFLKRAMAPKTVGTKRKSMEFLLKEAANVVQTFNRITLPERRRCLTCCSPVFMQLERDIAG